MADIVQAPDSRKLCYRAINPLEFVTAPDRSCVRQAAHTLAQPTTIAQYHQERTADAQPQGAIFQSKDAGRITSATTCRHVTTPMASEMNFAMGVATAAILDLGKEDVEILLLSMARLPLTPSRTTDTKNPFYCFLQ